jgi:serine/threonine protein kinase
VELARDRKTGDRVALKVFHNINTSPLQTNNIFVNEKQMLQRLERCHGIVRLLSWSS